MNARACVCVCVRERGIEGDREQGGEHRRVCVYDGRNDCEMKGITKRSKNCRITAGSNYYKNWRGTDWCRKGERFNRTIPCADAGVASLVTLKSRR